MFQRAGRLLWVGLVALAMGYSPLAMAGETKFKRDDFLNSWFRADNYGLDFSIASTGGFYFNNGTDPNLPISISGKKFRVYNREGLPTLLILVGDQAGVVLTVVDKDTIQYSNDRGVFQLRRSIYDYTPKKK